ncbi:MAG: hypothetical protein E7331_11915 [Clostridiales bacterium]|nr:hypothetical protein [Clostridiales bacterium]
MLAYLRVQLLHKLRGFGLGAQSNEKKSKGKTILSGVGITVLMLYLYGIVIFLEYMIFDTLTGMPLLSVFKPEYVLIMAVLLVSSLLTLIYGFFTVNAQLFFSDDVSSVAALPLSGRSVLTVRMISAWASDAFLTLLAVLPLAVMISLKTGFDAILYVKLLVICLCVPLLPLTVDMILSFLLIRISGLWKRREGVTVIATFLMMFLVIAGQLKLQGMAEEELSQMLMSLLVGEKSIVSLILANYPPLQWAADGLMKTGTAAWGSLALFVAVSIGVFALAVFLLGKGYLPLAVKQSEIRTVLNKGERRMKGSGDARSPRKALYMQEMRELLTVPAYVTNGLAGVIMIPLMLGVMFFTVMQTGEMGEVFQLLNQVLNPEVVFAVVLGLGIFSSSICVASTSVSREGQTHEMRKTMPISGMDHLVPKLWVGMTVNSIALVVIAVAACVLLPDFWLAVTLGFVMSQVASFLLNALSLAFDAAHPKLNWKTEQEAIKSNFNSMIVFLEALGLLVLLGAVVFGVIKLGGGYSQSMFGIGLLAVCFLLAGLAVLSWMLLSKKAAKDYYLH